MAFQKKPKAFVPKVKAAVPAAQSCSMDDSKTSGFVTIDYPQENEVLTSSSYTINLKSSENVAVEVSIDGGDWSPCRWADGNWWFDWANYPLGNHKIVARIIDSSGKTVNKSKVRKCVYRV